jgi:hypothetical protein
MALQLLEQRGRPRGQLAEQVFPFVAKRPRVTAVYRLVRYLAARKLTRAVASS